MWMWMVLMLMKRCRILLKKKWAMVNSLRWEKD